jgi:hypothetical protein
MGTSTACAYATIYYSYHEETQLLKPQHHLLFYHRLIDDAIIIQAAPPGPPGAYANFLKDMNSFGEPGRRLEWEATTAGGFVDFLDFTIILRRGQIKTRTFQKVMNL